MKQIYLKETRKNKNKQQREETPINKHDIKNFSYFDRDLRWWQQSIQYGNTKIPRFILTPYFFIYLFITFFRVDKIK